jgi:ribonuclease P/MRP protein subunit POP5
MVRIKHRYLLVNLLYPEGSRFASGASATASQTSSLRANNSNHSLLQFHAPTSDLLTPGLLVKLLREEIAELFGDWGVGRLGSGLSGKIY